jgi:BirA family transcriptional regulator, biotin operon repressor / biotin---[acetyl-CoA-carboxylase] ligase
MEHRNIIYLEKIDSTNNYALKNIKNLKDRDIVVSDIQSSGKGRYGRSWASNVFGNVYMSIVLKPDPEPVIPNSEGVRDLSSCSKEKFLEQRLGLKNINQYTSVILCRVFEKYFKLSPSIKWPNDILFDEKKIAGILVESNIEHGKITGLVIGLGVNLAMSEYDIARIDKPATSLNILLKRQIDRNDFINKFLKEFFYDYESFLNLGFKYIKDEYIKRNNFLGKEILIQILDDKYKCFAEKINDDGTLVIRTQNNETKIITTGEIL